MRLTAKYGPSQNPGALHAGSGASKKRDDTFQLVLSPMEWKEVHALAHFAQSGLAYDCAAPYVTQVFEYHLSEPEDLQSDENLQAAFSAVAQMAETLAADGRNGGDVTLGLPKEEMRQLLVILRMAASAEEQADFLYNGARDAFPYPFPDLTVPSSDYAQAFNSLLISLHHDNSLVIEVKARDNAVVPKLDAKKLPPELRTYLEGAIRNLRAQHPEIYADDARTIEIQTDELIDKMNSESLRRYRAAPLVNPESAPSYAPRNPFDYSELEARVKEQGGRSVPHLQRISCGHSCQPRNGNRLQILILNLLRQKQKDSEQRLPQT
jgi:hypothetical protein